MTDDTIQRIEASVSLNEERLEQARDRIKRAVESISDDSAPDDVAVDYADDQIQVTLKYDCPSNELVDISS